MRSATKRALEPGLVGDLVRDAFGSPPRRITPLTGGMFNSAYRVETDAAPAAVLEVSPPPDAPALTYERDCLRSEVLFEGAAREAGFPVPEVLYHDFSRRRVDGDVVFTRCYAGRSWWACRRDLTPRDARRMRGELGEVVARLHSGRGPVFGYPQPAAAASASSWRGAFGRMIGNLLDDAARWRVRLPLEPGQIRARFDRHADLLDSVTAPAPVHFDLWAGNVFLRTTSHGWELEGAIDAERMLWGDPVAEFASLALFGDIEDDRAFLAGYGLGAGAPVVFDRDLRRRLAMYKAYLYLIMVVEAGPRAYPWYYRHSIVRRASRLAARELTVLGR